MKKFCISPFLLILFLLSFSQVSAICRDNFSVNYSYQGQDKDPNGSFSNKDSFIEAGDFFKTNLSIKATGSELVENGNKSSIVLLMDRSSSMLGCQEYSVTEDDLAWDNQEDAIENAINACKEGKRKNEEMTTALEILLGKFAADDACEECPSGYLEEGNQIAFISFNENVVINSTFSFPTNYPKIFNLIDQYSETARGKTNIGNALSTALFMIENKNEKPDFSNVFHQKLNDKNKLNQKNRRFIILATDGSHNIGVNPMQVATGIKDTDLTIYTIGIGPEADHKLLKFMAEDLGSGEGKYYYSDVNDLATIFGEIGEEIIHPFHAQNVTIKLPLSIFSNKQISLMSTFPMHSHYSHLNETIEWFDLPSGLKNNEVADFSLIMKNNDIKDRDVALNKGFVTINYNEKGQNCVEEIPIDIVRVGGKIRNYSCLGSEPENSFLCSGDDVGLSSDVDRKLVTVCTQEIKCEHICKQPYVYFDGVCQLPVNGVCQKDLVFKCGLPQGDLCLLGAPKGISYNEATKRWEWSCLGESGGASSEKCIAEDLCLEVDRYYNVNP